jgi:hypothetical protein
MATGFYKVPDEVNETVRTYARGSKDREKLLAMFL